jgi:hypothetical protein
MERLIMSLNLKEDVLKAVREAKALDAAITEYTTPKFRKPTAPPPPSVPPVRTACTYKTPCGWCTKWDKKCDKKIGCGNEKPQRGLRANANMYDDAMDLALKDIISGKGLSRLDTNLDPNKPLPSGIRKEFTND